MDSVVVLMSTYNGDRFLEEQIESILKQKDVDVVLYVRDDGSSDRTKQILDEYQRKNAKMLVFYEKNEGVGNSFMDLVYMAPETSDYYAFADQDDIWRDTKLIEAIKLLKQSGKNLYVSNQECVDKNGKQLKKARFTETPDLSEISILCKNPVAGCTMVFSNAFYKSLSAKQSRPTARLLKNRIHDVWVDMVGAVKEDIIYDPRSFILYRLHENNVVGIKKNTAYDILKAQWKKLRNPQERNGRSILAQEIVRCFPGETSKNRLIQIAADSRKMKNKILLIQNNEVFRHYTGETKLGFALKVLLGFF